MFRSAVQRVGKFLLDVTSSEPEPRVARRRPETRRARQQAFDRRTRASVATRPDGSAKVLAGSVQLIGMDEIKASLGAGWPVVAETAHAIVERTIHRHLADEDTFERHRDNTYVLCFIGADKADAERRTRRIVGEIKAALQTEAPEAAGLRVDHTVAELDWAEVEERSEEEGSLLEALAGSLRKVQEEAKEAAKAWRRALLRDARVLYGPMWRLANRDVSLYRCLVDESTGKSTLERLRAVSNPDEVSEAVSDLDCLILSRAVEGLHKLLQAGGSAELLVPVNYLTMHDRTRREAYLTLGRSVPEPYRKFLIFELHSIPVGAPLSRVVELAQMLKPHGHAVAVDATDLSPQRVTQLGASGLFAVSIATRAVAGTPSEIIARFSRFAMVAKSAGLKTIAHGADTIGFAQAATGADIDFVGGNALGASLDAPKAGRHLQAVA